MKYVNRMLSQAKFNDFYQLEMGICLWRVLVDSDK